MFSMCCGDCGARWEIGTSRTCVCPDEAPKRTWVGLTDEEVKEISLANRPYVVDMVVALEARLKQKNGYAEENT